MVGFLTSPTPYVEGRRFLRDKPVLTMEQFDGLIPELKARSFIITGIEDHDVLQRIRDRIAEIPAGADWNVVKREIIQDMSPWFVDPEADEETRAKQQRKANIRAELLLRHHTGQAYARAKYEQLMANKLLFPFWQYRDFGDNRVRETHAALNMLALPAGDPFWVDHFPPWEWLCRCIVVGLTAFDVQRIREEDAKLPLDQRKIIEGEAYKMLSERGQLVRGPNEIYDVRSPAVKAAARGDDPAKALQWNPADTFMRASEILSRYDGQTVRSFVRWAQKQKVTWSDGGEQSIWGWMRGDKPVYLPAVIEPRGRNVEKLLKDLGLDDDVTPWTAEKMSRLRAGLIKENPVLLSDLNLSVSGTGFGEVTPARVLSRLQEFASMLRKGSMDTGKTLKIRLSNAKSKGVGGFFREPDELVIYAKELVTQAPDQIDRVIFHELVHWTHIMGNRSYDPWRKDIKRLWNERTRGTLPKRHPQGWNYYEDDWYRIYTGRVYEHGPNEQVAEEVATTHLEMLVDPAELAHTANAKKSFRDVFRRSLGMFD